MAHWANFKGLNNQVKNTITPQIISSPICTSTKISKLRENGRYLKQIRKVIKGIKFNSQEDIRRYFNQQEAVRVLPLKSNGHTLFCNPQQLTFKSKTNTGEPTTMSERSINSETDDSEVTINYKMGQSPTKRTLSSDTSPTDHDDDKVGPTSTQAEHGSSDTQGATGNSDPQSVEYLTLQDERQEIQSLKHQLRKADEGSMQYMFLNLELKIKQDNLKLLERVNMVSLNTATTKSTTDQLRVDLDEVVKSLETTQEIQDKQQSTVVSQASKIQDVLDKIEYLQGTVEKQAQEIMLLKQSNEQSTARNMKALIYFHNVDEVNKESNDDTYRLAKEFIQQKLEISETIDITKAVQEGKKEPRSILVTLSNPAQKGLIYSNTSKLKNKKNSTGKAFVVTDKLPAGQSEYKRSQRDALTRIKSTPDGDKISAKFKKGKLYVGNKVFTPSVQPPNVSDIISPQDAVGVQSVHLTQGSMIRYEGCTFVAMSMEAKSITDVKNGYIRARQLHPKALHVSNAYRLPGNMLDAEGYADDGEHGCGRIILRLLSDWNIHCRSIYLARYYGNEHLGTKRFSQMVDAVKSAIARSSYNEILRCEQFPWEEEPNYQHQSDYTSIRGRGSSHKSTRRSSPPFTGGRNINGGLSYKDTLLTPSKKTKFKTNLTLDPAVQQILSQQQMLTRSQANQDKSNDLSGEGVQSNSQ